MYLEQVGWVQLLFSWSPPHVFRFVTSLSATGFSDAGIETHPCTFSEPPCTQLAFVKPAGTIGSENVVVCLLSKLVLEASRGCGN